MIGTFFLALGLVLIVEGLVYALAPSSLEQILALLRSLREDQICLIGLACIAAGVVLVWCAKMLGV
ncbi:DUF2065 domain-containing protein [Roseovarius aestuariivivens]|uniref:DUF2065 domain-containing protein n=1 Tax=Roseovarius aestuariivivens TaxID=1888910 RepID=UPI001AEBAF39|nr:DUF2065 domain-containing protein [Roseovarius aestuariivivens]